MDRKSLFPSTLCGRKLQRRADEIDPYRDPTSPGAGYPCHGAFLSWYVPPSCGFSCYHPSPTEDLPLLITLHRIPPMAHFQRARCRGSRLAQSTATQTGRRFRHPRYRVRCAYRRCSRISNGRKGTMDRSVVQEIPPSNSHCPLALLLLSNYRRRFRQRLWTHILSTNGPRIQSLCLRHVGPRNRDRIDYYRHSAH